MPAAIPFAILQAAKQDYIQGLGDIKTIAERHNLNVETLKKKATNSCWTHDRAEFQRRRSQRLLTGAILPSNRSETIDQDFFRALGHEYHARAAELLTVLDLLLNDITEATPDKRPRIVASYLDAYDALREVIQIPKIAPRKLTEKRLERRSLINLPHANSKAEIPKTEDVQMRGDESSPECHSLSSTTVQEPSLSSNHVQVADAQENA